MSELTKIGGYLIEGQPQVYTDSNLTGAGLPDSPLGIGSNVVTNSAFSYSGSLISAINGSALMASNEAEEVTLYDLVAGSGISIVETGTSAIINCTGKQDNLTFSYTTANEISAINSSAIAGGGADLSNCVKYTDKHVAIGNGNVTDPDNLTGHYDFVQGDVNTGTMFALVQGAHNSATLNSFAQGESNKSRQYSLTQGYDCLASGYSIAQGDHCKAIKYSQAFGESTSATNSGMAIGYFNKTDSAAFVIGNGTWDAKSDAFIVYHDGSVSAAGKISANGVELGAGGGVTLPITGTDGDQDMTLDEYGLYIGIPEGGYNTTEAYYGTYVSMTQTDSDNTMSIYPGFIEIGDSTSTATINAQTVRDLTSVSSTVNSNSGAWGGSALPISAGAGISISLIDNVLVISTASV